MSPKKKTAGRPKKKDKDKARSFPVSLTLEQNAEIIKQHGSRTKAILTTIKPKK